MDKEQILNGIIRYFDYEVAPKIPMLARWGGGAVFTIAAAKVDKIYDLLSNNQIAKFLDVVDEEGRPDIDLIADALAQSAQKYGKFIVDKVPGFSATFSEKDVILLKEYIKGEK